MAVAAPRQRAAILNNENNAALCRGAATPAKPRLPISGNRAILEYAFWPPAARGVSRLIIVGEAAMDEECKKYLQVLKKHFSLPIEYLRLKVE